MQLLRLEVERPVDEGELLNLVLNPSGELGAWFWVTPVAGSSMVAFPWSGVDYLVFMSPGSVPSYVYTEPMPADAGQYAAARWIAPGVGGQYKTRIEWLDVDKELISASAQSSAYTGSADARVYGSSVAPSGTVWCRLRFDHYDGSGGNPTALSTLALREVTLTVADTDAIGWVRTNLIRNPSAETSAAFWNADDATIAVSSSQAYAGDQSFIVTKNDGKKGPMVARIAVDDVVPGRDYALQARFRPGTTARKVTVAARWFDAAGKQITQATAKAGEETAGAWSSRLGGIVTAPSGADRLQLRIVWAAVPDGESHYFDAVMAEESSTLGTYFDGDIPTVYGVDFAWTGTAGLSTSTATGPTGDPGTLVPVPYQNIMGPTSQISVDREGLNVGSLTVKLFDAALDPSQSDLIKTGKRIRLVLTPPSEDDDAVPQILFAGKVFTGSVAYHLLHPDERKRAEVTLTAVDPINPLAAAPQREGVATIDDLPHVLEGAGVPWSCNGNGNHVADPDVVAYNDNASALDQVAVTRDSNLGYAWVDRNGVLQAWDRDEINTAVMAELDESTYTADGFNIDFDTSSIINSVTIRALKVIATTGATEEVTFGPYMDLDSYREYGEHAQEFTVQGFDTSDAASIQAFAEQILAASATPQLRVNELVLPIVGPRVAEPAVDRALLDLYDLVTVVNDRASLDSDVRIVRIHHEITANARGGQWRTTLGFTADGSVAPATAVPAPPPGVGEVREELEVSIQEALDAAVESFDFAATLNKVYRQPTAPTNPDDNGRALVANDPWFDTDDGNKQHKWSGSAWVDASQSWLITNPSGTFPNVVISPAGLAAYDSGGDVVTSIDSADGTITTSGSLWVAGEIDGAIVTGGVLQTDAAADTGIKMNSAGFAAFDSSGDPTFAIDASDGSILMLGGLVTDATVTGGIIRTAASGRRVELNDAYNDLRFYNSGDSLMGSVDYVQLSGTDYLIVDGPGSNQMRVGSSITRNTGDFEVQGTLTVGSFSPPGGYPWVGSASSDLDMNGNDITDGGIITADRVNGDDVYVTSTPGESGTGLGTVYMGGSGRLRLNSSARKYKTNIEPLTVDLDRWLQFEPVTYDPISGEDRENTVGFIANQADELGFTHLVGYRDGEVESLHYERVGVYQQAVLRNHHPRIAELEQQVAGLLSRIEALEGQ